LPYPATDFETVEARQHEIEDNHIRGNAAHSVNRRRPIRCTFHPLPRGLGVAVQADKKQILNRLATIEGHLRDIRKNG